jgi:hypothetical protein
MLHDKYPTLHALGLGEALDEMERLCALGQAGKYKGKALNPSQFHHLSRALAHLRGFRCGERVVDEETQMPVLVNVATRFLMMLATSLNQRAHHEPEPPRAA